MGSVMGLGMPKICYEIEIQDSSSAYHMQVSWRGASFATVDLADFDVEKEVSCTSSGE